MRPNVKQLTARDPALAALFGVAAFSAVGANFGAEASEDSFGNEFGDDYGDDVGYEFAGDDMGADFGAAPKMRTAPAALAIRNYQQQVAARRVAMLQPNKGSPVKVERYSFSVNQTLTLGTAVAVDASGQPDTTIRPQRVTMNIPAPGMMTVTDIKVANVGVLVGGTDDAHNYNANGVGQQLDLPTLSPANRVRVVGNYNGFTPPGYGVGASYIFVASFKGPATIVA